MYNAFFGFRKTPFASSPDPEFFFRSKQHDAALKGLLLSVEARMGLVSLVGDEGTGKTAVLECLRKSLGPDIPCAFVRDSRISFGRLLDTIASDLNLDLRFATKSAPQVFLALTRLTTQQARNGRTVVLIVDEAHNLPANVFDEIIHTASLHHDSVKAIQTIFAGRPEMQPRLAALNPDRAGQRAILSRSLQAFTARETKEYVEFRLACAGMPKQTVFPRRALQEIYDRSQGLAPKIHALCDKLLLSAFAATSTVCTREIIADAFADPQREHCEIIEHYPLLVAAVEIVTSDLVPTPEPEPPPMQTTLLRVTVGARLGALHPLQVLTDLSSFAGVVPAIELPRARFSLAGGDLAPKPAHNVSLKRSTSAVQLSTDLGRAIFSIPLSELTPNASLAASALCRVGNSRLGTGKLITLPLLPLRSIDAFTPPVPDDFCRPPQMGPATSLQRPSVILCSQIPLRSVHACGHDPLVRTEWRLADVEPLNFSPIATPASKGMRDVLEPIIQRPNGLLPLPVDARPIKPPAEMPIGHLSSVPPALFALPPQLRLKPADPARRFLLRFPTLSLFQRPSWIPQIASPSPKRLLVFVIPILAALALYSATPAVRAAANTSRQEWQQTQGMILNRAAIALDEDFRSGLSDWQSGGGSLPAWSSDASGFVRPGALALYQPSAGMIDYQMKFLGMIDKKGLSWVARAADFNNYYAIRLSVLTPGPLPMIGVTRYAVIRGVPQKRVTTRLFMSARADTIYRVLLDTNEDRFTLSVQDQPVDSWSDSRLRRGGIGFFSEKDAESRISSLHVRGHYDMLGRLCAFLMSPGTLR